MDGGDAFPSREDLLAAATRLEVASARLAERAKAHTSKDRRRRAREVLKRSWFAVEELGASIPGSREARLATRRGRDMELILAEALGEDPHPGLRDPTPASAGPSLPEPPPDPMRLDWPVRYDLDRIERLGEPARVADAMAGRLDAAAAALEARATQAAAGGAQERAPMEPGVDMDVMELAKAKRRRGPAR